MKASNFASLARVSGPQLPSFAENQFSNSLLVSSTARASESLAQKNKYPRTKLGESLHFRVTLFVTQRLQDESVHFYWCLPLHIKSRYHSSMRFPLGCLTRIRPVGSVEATFSFSLLPRQTNGPLKPARRGDGRWILEIVMRFRKSVARMRFLSKSIFMQLPF